MKMHDMFRMMAMLVAIMALAVLASGCGMLGGGGKDPMTVLLKSRPVFFGGHININLPNSQPVIVAGSSGSQVSTNPGAAGGGDTLADGTPAATAVNYMHTVTIGQEKAFDLGAILTNLQDIARSSATTTPSQAQRQSTAEASGQGGAVTAPATTTIAPAIAVPVTGTGTSNATSTTAPTPGESTGGGATQGE